MRGVHISRSSQTTGTPGSSPHARGPPNRRVRACLQIRIIPACAGSTIAWISSHSRWRDHPRMRGVHLTVTSLKLLVLGSSPHARGPP